MEQAIKQWGYIVVFLGSMIEGESVVITAGFLAHEGYLSLPKIIAISFFGTLIADQGLYHLDRYQGVYFLTRFPRLKPRADRAFLLLHRYNGYFILAFRFIYGIRTISPLVIGASGISPKRFTVLNLIAASIWSVLSCLVGYFFGDVIMNQQSYLSKYIFGGLFVLGMIGYSIYKFFK
ncbi:MAG: DedA family protein [Alphaproteobacteria bacterium]|nr:DedA family protein [Alphaproteobacteria bacterium]